MVTAIARMLVRINQVEATKSITSIGITKRPFIVILHNRSLCLIQTSRHPIPQLRNYQKIFPQKELRDIVPSLHTLVGNLTMSTINQQLLLIALSIHSSPFC